MVSKLFTLAVLGLLLSACQTSQLATDTVPTGGEPVVVELAPTTASSGQSVTVKGTGFSLVPEENIISINGTTARAKTYALTGQQDRPEAITFEVPAGVTPGTLSLVVTVLDSTSNSVSLTVTP